MIQAPDDDLVALTDLELLDRMIDDACYYRDSDREEFCYDCNTFPPDQSCPDHVNDHYLAERYALLGDTLGRLLREARTPSGAWREADKAPEVHDLAVVTGMALNRIPVEVWACSDCGCVFLPDWIGGEPGEVYPDRYEMTVPHRAEPDNHQCDCHNLPRTMKIPKDNRKDI